MRKFLLLLALSILTLVTSLIMAQSPEAQAQNSAPTLTIATGIQATAGSTVTVSIDFRNNARSIVSIAFALEVDPTCLHFDPIDRNGDRQPDAVTFVLPVQSRGSIKADPASGRLEIVIADYAPPLATLPDTDGLIQLTFMATCTPEAGQSMVVAVDFSTVPAASFSDPQGKTVAGMVTSGTVIINPALSGTPSPSPTPSPTPTLIPTLPPNLSMALNAWAAPSTAQAGDVVTYTYRITNTGELSITVEAADDQVGKVVFTRLSDSTDLLPMSLLGPGQVAVGTNHYTVQPCNSAGSLINTITATGTTISGVVFTIQSSTSITLKPTPFLAPLTAEANTIYTGCAIQLSITPNEMRNGRTYHMVVVAGPSPSDLVLSGVQAIYPYSGLHSMIDQTNLLIRAGCVANDPCNSVRRTLFGYGATYQIETIQTVQRVTDLFFPVVQVRCILPGLGCKYDE
jgi:hypothetical protein